MRKNWFNLTPHLLHRPHFRWCLGDSSNKNNNNNFVVAVIILTSFRPRSVLLPCFAASKPPLVSVNEYEKYAAAHLPKMVYDYYRSGATDEITLRVSSD